jgi:hypothetical protein
MSKKQPNMQRRSKPTYEQLEAENRQLRARLEAAERTRYAYAPVSESMEQQLAEVIQERDEWREKAHRYLDAIITGVNMIRGMEQTAVKMSNEARNRADEIRQDSFTPHLYLALLDSARIADEVSVDIINTQMDELAEKAGLQKGDTIKVADQPEWSVSDSMLRAVRAGSLQFATSTLTTAIVAATDARVLAGDIMRALKESKTIEPGLLEKLPEGFLKEYLGDTPKPDTLHSALINYQRSLDGKPHHTTGRTFRKHKRFYEGMLRAAGEAPSFTDMLEEIGKRAGNVPDSPKSDAHDIA